MGMGLADAHPDTQGVVCIAKVHEAMASALKALRNQIGSRLEATLHNGSQISEERVTEIFDAMRQLCGSEISLQLHSQQRQQ